MPSPYRQRINTDHPGMFIILIDQSSSMDEMYSGEKKSVVAAKAVNDLIYVLRAKSIEGTDIRDRFYLAVIGYGETVGGIVNGKISEYTNKIIRIDQKPETNANGQIVSIETPIWIEPKAGNGTPMAEALDYVYNLAHLWVNKTLDSFPPVVINITDGMPNDLQSSGGDGKMTYEAAQRLMDLNTNYGNLVLLNAHFGDSSKDQVLLPNDINLLTDQYAKYLFNMSSVIPEPLVEYAKKANFEPAKNARGLVFNAGAERLIDLLNFGSSKFT